MLVAELQRRKESEEIKQREESSGTEETPSATLPSVFLVVWPSSVNPDVSVNSSGSSVTASNSTSDLPHAFAACQVSAGWLRFETPAKVPNSLEILSMGAVPKIPRSSQAKEAERKRSKEKIKDINQKAKITDEDKVQRKIKKVERKIDLRTARQPRERPKVRRKRRAKEVRKNSRFGLPPSRPQDTRLPDWRHPLNATVREP